MSEETQPIDPESEAHAFALARKLFNWTLIGTAIFSAAILIIWKFSPFLFS